MNYLNREMSDRINTPPLKNQGRYPILDALRIVLAFWVVMGHLGFFPLFVGADTATRFGRTLVHAWNSIVWGVPAVIGFFVISGFCIHLPFRHDEELSVGRYYARRYTRILVPVAVAIIIYKLTGDRGAIIGARSILWNSVLWSLACEEIYYAAYPLIRLLRKRLGWGVVLSTAFLLASLMALTHPGALDGSALGTLETALTLFPVWLLGCVLAEQSDHLSAIDSSLVIWKWRFLAWFGSWICEILHFKAGVSITQTMLVFGILAYFWIRKEISYGIHRPPWTALASAGLWSYSLYLIHIPAAAIYAKLSIPSLGYILNWCTLSAFILGLSYLFYLAVEKPSHRFARRIGVIRDHKSGLASIAAGGLGQTHPSPQDTTALNS
jgi:peptidoglycan/LPS O-acetylase OafA/YrhL